MKHWLIKSEPDECSIDQLAQARAARPGPACATTRRATTCATACSIGDEVFFYHSNCAAPGIVGLCTVAKLAYPDPTQFDPGSDYFDAASPRDQPRWLCVDVAFQRKLKRTITLEELKALDGLGDFALTRRGNRLSVLPVTAAQWQQILSLE